VRRRPALRVASRERVALATGSALQAGTSSWKEQLGPRVAQVPVGAQVILNGHEYVACAARQAGIGFRKEGNCFTHAGDPERLAQIADTFSQPGGIGRLSQVIDRWIYGACLCCGLCIDEQQQSGFRYDYSIYQVEYSRNLAFACGAVMDRLFNTMIDRTRSRLDKQS